MTTGSNRITAGVERGPAFRFTADGQPVEAYSGESVAGALLAAGRRVARRTARRGTATTFSRLSIATFTVAVISGRSVRSRGEANLTTVT